MILLPGFFALLKKGERQQLSRRTLLDLNY